MARTIDGPDKNYLSIEEVAAYLRLSETTLKRLMRAGEFPRPQELSPGVKLWPWRAVIYWQLRVEMRPYLRESRKKERPTRGHRGPRPGQSGPTE